MPHTDQLALTSLPRSLAALTGAPSPSYRRLYAFVVDGRLPAEQENGRWFFRRTDLPAIATTLGLTVPGAAKAAPPKARKAATIAA